MRIGLFIDLAGQRQWHRWLADDVARAGDDLIVLRPDAAAMVAPPAALHLALWVDPVLFRLKGEHAFDPLANPAIPERSAKEAPAGLPLDVLIDASSCDGPRPPARRVIRLLFNSVASELAAVAALLDDCPVTVSIDGGPGDIQEVAKPGLAQRQCLTASLDNVFSVVVELLSDRISSRFVTAAGPNRCVNPEDKGTRHGATLLQTGAAAGLRYLANAISTKAASYLTRRLGSQKTWAIATRPCSGDGLVHGDWPATASFDILPDDGRRYYADPVLFERGGQCHLFAEEYPYATQRGTICVAEVGRDGRVGDFRPALESQHHLSYPFVFEYSGQVWMVPEACAGGSVELFRAEEYPHKWVHDRTLIAGVAGCDATILHDAGRFVMVLTTQRWLGTTWDNQRIFYAASPLGPWTEHATGLIRIDNALARPAGPALQRGDRLLRPVQNCADMYGGGITVLEVRYPEGGEPIETPVATLFPAAPRGVIGTHTYTRSRSLEAVDVYGDLSGLRRVEIKCTPIAT